MRMLLTTLAILCISQAAQRSFVDTAPLSEGSTDEGSNTSAQDTSVRELENLKHSLGKTLQMMKSQSAIYMNVNGEKQAHSDTKEEVNENGNLVARLGQHIDSETKGLDGTPLTKVRTDVEIPAKGIHKSVIQQLPADYPTLTENGNRRNPTVDSSLGGRLSPMNMAEYVFWTGDEKGVTLSIEEFIQEGLMTREEAISFLEDIKYELEYLKFHYADLGLNSIKQAKQLPKQQLQDHLNKNTGVPSWLFEKLPKLQQQSRFNINQLNQLKPEVNEKREPKPTQYRLIPSKADSKSEKSQDEDYDELLERLRVADFLYTEYSLEEVIYQLAKVMFTSSLTRGSSDAQQALQKFTNFLEIEAEQGHISRALEKKVLDVLIASLSDTLAEHPELLSAARDGLGSQSSNADGQHFIRQILELSPDDKITVQDILAYKEHNRNNQSKEGKISSHGLGLGKYKNP